jgi:hypothetical protein
MTRSGTTGLPNLVNQRDRRRQPADVSTTTETARAAPGGLARAGNARR